MANISAPILLLLLVALACAIVNAQQSTDNQKQTFGQTFDEIVVSSDLNVRRKSKENRQGRRVLSNVPTGTTGSPIKSTVFATRSTVNKEPGAPPSSRGKRDAVTLKDRYLGMGVPDYLLKSRKR